MVSTMTTRNAGRRTAATRGEGTSEQDGREGDRSGDQVGRGKGGQSGRGSQGGGQDSQESDQGSQGCSRGNGANRGGGGVPNFATIIAQQLQNLLPTILAMLRTLIDSIGLLDCAMVATTELTIIQSAVLKAEMLTDEEIKNGALKKISKKRGNNGEPSRDRNVRDDNKRSKTGRAFSIITNPVRKEYTGAAPKCPNCNYHHQPEVPCRLCTNFNRFGHIAKDCRMGPRVVNPLNARNPTAARRACFECGGTDHYKEACPRLNRAPRPEGNHPNQAMAVGGGQGRGNNGN
ncbi:reverse transcriptase domain-containing protein [Tanacetum coccineum]